MKTAIALILLTLLTALSSCEKEPITTTNESFISFNLDGTPIEIRSPGGGSNTGVSTPNSTLANYDDTAIYDHATLWFDFGKNVVEEADFLALAGQTLEVGSCSGVSSNCGVKSSFNYADTNLDLISFEMDNPSPEYYVKINSVTESYKDSSLEWYVVEGEFNLQLRKNGGNLSTIQDATNGKFRLLFPKGK